MSEQDDITRDDDDALGGGGGGGGAARPWDSIRTEPEDPLESPPEAGEPES